MTLPPLIARDLLFGNPENIGPQLSPDATMLAYLAPHEGLLSVWVRGRHDGEARVVAHDHARPIHRIFWQGDSRHILYLQDRAGNENYHLFRVDADAASSNSSDPQQRDDSAQRNRSKLPGGTPQDAAPGVTPHDPTPGQAPRGRTPEELTPGERVKVEILDIDPRFPNDVLLVSNERDERLFDVHRLDLASGSARLDTENPGDVSGWLADNDFIVRAATVQNPDGSSLIRVRDDASSPWRILDEFAFEDGFGGPIAFTPDNRSLYAITAKDSNAARLLKYDLSSGTNREVVADPTYDIASAYVDPATKALVAAAVARDRVEWIVLDPAYEADFAAMRVLHAGDLSVDGASADGNALIVHFSNDTGPTPYYVYDRIAKNGTLLFYSRPALLDYALAPMQPIVVRARDGLDLHGYLTLPVGVDGRGLPTAMVVHGGPWHRDRFGYDPFAQWLANRGYAVVQINFRGSTGYGKAFLNAGNREWAGAMRTDLLDARDWMVERGIADPSRFAIIGGSYGGYAVLAALTFTPEAFSCGIDIVGPSNLGTLLGSIPPYWETLRATFTKRMGEDEAFLRKQSPLFRAADIRAPLLIAQGANDPRVKEQESEQIVAALRKNGVPVTYMLFEDEGHGFLNPANNKRFTAAAEAFLGRTLGGRVEPPHPGEEIEPFLR